MVQGQLGTAAGLAITGKDGQTLSKGKKATGGTADTESFADSGIEDGVVPKEDSVREPMNMIQIFRNPLIRRIALMSLLFMSLNNLSV